MTINSKALKPRKFRWQYEDEDKNFFQNLFYHFKMYVYWPITDSLRGYKERTRRAYDYAKFGWSNYDFDLSYVYEVFEFKLKRLKNSLVNGSSVQKPEDMAALSELIKIVRRLRYDRYDQKYLRLHDLKWGKIETKTTPNYDENGKVKTYTWHSWRSKTNGASEKVKKEEWKEFSACYTKAEEDKHRDIKRMAEILILNGNSFWD